MEKRILITVFMLIAMAIPSVAFADLAPIQPTTSEGISLFAIIGVIAVVIIALVIIKIFFSRKK